MVGKMLYACTMQKSGDSQNGVLMRYRDEWWLPGCYVYALWTGVVAARMVHTHTHCEVG
jgi:hypothetical protein